MSRQIIWNQGRYIDFKQKKMDARAGKPTDRKSLLLTICENGLFMCISISSNRYHYIKAFPIFPFYVIPTIH